MKFNFQGWHLLMWLGLFLWVLNWDTVNERKHSEEKGCLNSKDVHRIVSSHMLYNIKQKANIYADIISTKQTMLTWKHKYDPHFLNANQNV